MWFLSDMKPEGSNWEDGKFSTNDGGGITGVVEEYWRSAKDGS